MEQRYGLVAVVLITMVSISAITIALLQSYDPPEADQLNFYVFGDSQGYQGGLQQIVASANDYRPDFVLHCGDLTPFGTETQYSSVVDVLDGLEVPLYTTPGNHDIRLGGGDRYLEHFGLSTYSFNIGPAHFTVFNTSASDEFNLSETDIAWLQEDLSSSDAEFKFVFTHIPPFDPRPDQDHTMANTTTASRLMSLYSEYNVDTVFTGHIHMFNISYHDGVRYVITGGIGASLYADTTNGGIYHFTNVTVTESGVIVEPVLLEPPSITQTMVVIRANNGDLSLTLDDLTQMSAIEGFSSFQNRYDNWQGYGTYRGVRVSDLIELAGGMDSYDKVAIIAHDGFTQEFSHSNVYPNASWYPLQGDMILAFQYNSSIVPDWSDGMRLVMLPPDEGYSNSDCLATSEPGMGCYVYSSAGARWVRFVSYIEVIEG